MISTTMMPIIVTGKTQLANHLVEAIDNSRAGEILDLTDDDHLVIITQGTARGGVKTIIDRCYTDIVSQIESVTRKDIRYIVIGSMSAEYTSFPGISNLAMIYANAKRSLSQYVSDYNQMIESKQEYELTEEETQQIDMFNNKQQKHESQLEFDFDTYGGGIESFK